MSLSATGSGPAASHSPDATCMIWHNQRSIRGNIRRVPSTQHESQGPSCMADHDIEDHQNSRMIYDPFHCSTAAWRTEAAGESKFLRERAGHAAKARYVSPLPRASSHDPGTGPISQTVAAVSVSPIRQAGITPRTVTQPDLRHFRRPCPLWPEHYVSAPRARVDPSSKAAV